MNVSERGLITGMRFATATWSGLALVINRFMPALLDRLLAAGPDQARPAGGGTR